MAESAQIAKLSDMHEEMVDWLILNPTKPRSEMAKAFQVTQPWLSTIIHSDVFQAKLAAKKGIIFNNAIARPLQERLLGAAHIALDRLEEALVGVGDVEVFTKAVDMLAKATGNFRSTQQSGPLSPPGSVFVQNNYSVTPEDLARARQLVGRAKQSFVEALDGSSEELGRDNDKEVSVYREDRVGPADSQSALPNLDQTTQGKESGVSAGAQV